MPSPRVRVAALLALALVYLSWSGWAGSQGPAVDGSARQAVGTVDQPQGQPNSGERWEQVIGPLTLSIDLETLRVELTFGD